MKINENKEIISRIRGNPGFKHFVKFVPFTEYTKIVSTDSVDQPKYYGPRITVYENGILYESSHKIWFNHSGSHILPDIKLDAKTTGKLLNQFVISITTTRDKKLRHTHRTVMQVDRHRSRSLMMQYMNPHTATNVVGIRIQERYGPIYDKVAANYLKEILALSAQNQNFKLKYMDKIAMLSAPFKADLLDSTKERLISAAVFLTLAEYFPEYFDVVKLIENIRDWTFWNSTTLGGVIPTGKVVPMKNKYPAVYGYVSNYLGAGLKTNVFNLFGRGLTPTISEDNAKIIADFDNALQKIINGSTDAVSKMYHNMRWIMEGTSWHK